MPPRATVRLALLTVVTLTFSGCAFLKNLLAVAFQKPTFTFKTAQVLDVSLAGATVNLVYELDNPNAIGISIAEVDYALFVEGKQVVAGKPPNGLQLPAQRKSEIQFPTAVKFQDIAPVVQTFLTKDRATYRAEGHIGLQSPIGVISFPISKEGEFEVPKVPTVQLRPPRISNLSLSGVTLELPVALTNRNTFELPVAGLSGALSISGVNVGNVSTGNVGALAGGATREVAIPVTLNLANAPAAVAAIRGGQARFALTGQLDSGGLPIPVNLNDVLNIRK